LLSRCRACTKLKNRVAYQAHADARRAAQREKNKTDRVAKAVYNRLYRDRHRDELIQASRDWRAAGNKVNRSPESVERQNARKRLLYATDPAYKERAKAYVALYRKTHPGYSTSSYKKWRAANLDKARKYSREYYFAYNQTPEGRVNQAAMRLKHRAKRQARQAAYYAKRYGESGVITNEYLNWLNKWQDHCCCYCNAPLNQKETIEHVVPLNRGGENNPHNVLLACSHCNTSKNQRLFDVTEWLPFSVQTPTRTHSIFNTGKALDACLNAGIPAEIDGDAILLRPGRRLRVLSTFWLSDRSEHDTTVASLHALYPSDLLTFDHEWQARPNAMLNVTIAKAGLAESIGARELDIEAPTAEEARAFMDHWHVQGFAGGSWYVGLRRHSGGDWCGMASFRRFGSAYELARLAFKDHVAGGLSRIVTAFMRAAPEPGDLLTYADTRFGEGGGYAHAGFEPDGESAQWYGYVNGVRIHSRQAYRKDAMATLLDWFDPEWSEHRLARVNGLWRLNGLPQKRFILRA
jgi:5-methylcytosine-specific restriction endonuclease McrA